MVKEEEEERIDLSKREAVAESNEDVDGMDEDDSKVVVVDCTSLQRVHARDVLARTAVLLLQGGSFLPAAAVEGPSVCRQAVGLHDQQVPPSAAV